MAVIPSPFSVEVRDAASGSARLVVAGELDLATAPALEEALADQMRAGRDVLLDLARVDFIDSCGLSTLIGAINEAKVNGWSMGISSDLSLSVRRLLQLTALEAEMPLVED